MTDIIETPAAPDPVICYVLCRTDTPGEPSLGRLAAQTHHNGTQMTEELAAKDFPDLKELYDEWQRDADLEAAADAAYRVYAENKTDETLAAMDEARQAAIAAKRTFGTVLTLAVTAAEMRQAVSLAQLFGLHAGITHDPTYPVKLNDGGKTIYVTAPVDSCAYIFGRKSKCAPIVGQFDLLHERHFAR